MKFPQNLEEATQALDSMSQKEREGLDRKIVSDAEVAKKLIPELIDIDQRFSLLIVSITRNYVKIAASGTNMMTFGQCLFEAMNFYRDNLQDKAPHEHTSV